MWRGVIYLGLWRERMRTYPGVIQLGTLRDGQGGMNVEASLWRECTRMLRDVSMEVHGVGQKGCGKAEVSWKSGGVEGQKMRRGADQAWKSSGGVEEQKQRGRVKRDDVS